MNWHRLMCVIIHITLVNSAVIHNDDVEEQGLYKKADYVEILTNDNFDRKVYGRNHAILIQFYNSYCGHCRHFSPKFKSLARDIRNWHKIIQPAVVDCSVEENNQVCRQFEVMAYPSLRYIHENYSKANGNVGEKVQLENTIEELKSQLIKKLQEEQTKGRLSECPSLKIDSYASYESVLSDLPNNVLYTFVVFETKDSTVGSELALDINEYQHIKVKRAYDTSELATVARVPFFPGLLAIHSNQEYYQLSPKTNDKQVMLKTVNTFLKSKNYQFPLQNAQDKDLEILEEDKHKLSLPDSDAVYYSDLEKTLQNSLHTEITRFKILKDESLLALLDYLDILIMAFPSRGNLREYLVDLRSKISTKNQWAGTELYDLIKELELDHKPVYSSTNLEYVACKGSQSLYRGYTCGLWTLFHTLTVNAARKTGNEGPKVLKAIHGYVKTFFGCTECAEHFQAMAARNRLFDVKESDKAVLWLWISHNEVNLRLAGDVTEDPEHPKIQFPSASRCPNCRLERGAWNLPAIYEYLQLVYGTENIRDIRQARSVASAPSPFSNWDIGMLSLLYMS